MCPNHKPIIPQLFQVLSTPKDGHQTSLIWQQGVCDGGRAPRPTNSSPGLGLFINQARWRRQLLPVDTEGGNPALSSDLPLPSRWRTSSVGKQPTVQHSPYAFPTSQSHNNLGRLPFNLFLPSFLPSFIQPTSLLCLCWVLGTQTGIGPIPCPQKAPSWHIPAALPFPALQAQAQVRPPGKSPAQGPQVWAESPRGRDIHGNPKRKRQSDRQDAERES